MNTCAKCGSSFPSQWIADKRDGACTLVIDKQVIFFCCGVCRKRFLHETKITQSVLPKGRRVPIRFPERAQFNVQIFREEEGDFYPHVCD